MLKTPFINISGFSTSKLSSLGEQDTRAYAEETARAKAMRKIIEQAGVYVESYTEVNNYRVTKDQIKIAARAMIKIVDEDVKFLENGLLCKVFLKATINTDDIGKFIK